VSIIAGLIFSVLARSTTSKEEDIKDRCQDTRVTAKQIFPYLSIFSVINFIRVHVESRKAQQIMSNVIKACDEPMDKYNSILKFFQMSYKKAPPYNVRLYGGVPLNMQAGWEACNVRNTIGYKGLALGTLLISSGIVAARVFNMHSSSKKN